MKHLLGVLTALVIGFTAFSASANDSYTNEYAIREYYNGHVQYCHHYTDMYGQYHKECYAERSRLPEYLLGGILGYTLHGLFDNHRYGYRNYGYSRYYGYSRHYGSRHRYNGGHRGVRNHNKGHDRAGNHNRRGGNDNHRRGNRRNHR